MHRVKRVRKRKDAFLTLFTAIQKDTVDMIISGNGGHIGGDMSVMEILETTVTLPRCEESSALGAGLLAGMTAGIYTMNTVSKWTNQNQYVPTMSLSDRNKMYSGWKDAIEKVLV